MKARQEEAYSGLQTASKTAPVVWPIAVLLCPIAVLVWPIAGVVCHQTATCACRIAEQHIPAPSLVHQVLEAPQGMTIAQALVVQLITPRVRTSLDLVRIDLVSLDLVSL